MTTPENLAPLVPRAAATHRLWLLNDGDTSYAFAVASLEAVFGVPRLAAERAVQHAHEHGRSPLADGTPAGLATAMDLMGRLAAHTGQTLRVTLETVPDGEVNFAASGFTPVLNAERI